MANALYGLGRQAFAEGNIAWLTDDIRAVLVDTATYIVAIDTDQYLSDIPAGERVSVSGAFTSKDATLGVCDAADITFNNVSGDQSEALVIYQHTGTDNTSRLIAYIDNAVGLPVTPGGGNIAVIWDNGTNRIFKL